MSFEKVPNFLPNFFEAQMSGNGTSSYRFNSFLLDVPERQLFHHDRSISLTPKAFDTLVYLIEHAGHLVLKDELMRAVWPDSFVDEVSIPRTVHTIRSTLGEDRNGNKFIETVPTKGYRFVARVEKVSGNGAGLPSPEPVFHPIDKGLESPDAGVAGSSSFSRNQTGGAVQKDPPSGHRRTVLILSFAAILMVSVTGFWVANRSGPAKNGVNGLIPQTNNGEAYEHYQQGRLLVQRGYAGELENALANFEKAIELDPGYAAAYAGKADAKMQIFWATNSHDDIAQVRTAIDQAIRLDDSNSYAHTILCRIKGTYDWDLKAAEKECRQAIDLDPADADAHREMAFFLCGMGREGEAVREIDTAVLLAPTSFNKRSRGLILYFSRRYDEAIEQLRQVEETDPSEYDTRRWLTNAYEMKKDYPRAVDARVRQMEREGATPEDLAAVRTAFDESGWSGVLKNMVDPSSPGKVGTAAAATAYAQLGDNDKAFESLEKMLDRRPVMMIQIEREPRLDPIRNDPRYDVLLKRIGLK